MSGVQADCSWLRTPSLSKSASFGTCSRLFSLLVYHRKCLSSVALLHPTAGACIAQAPLIGLFYLFSALL